MNRGRDRNRGRGGGRDSGRVYGLRGRHSPSPDNYSAHPKSHVGDDGSFDNAHFGQNDNLSHISGNTSGELPTKGIPKQIDQQLDLSVESLKLVENSPEAVSHCSKQSDCWSPSGSKSATDHPSPIGTESSHTGRSKGSDCPSTNSFDICVEKTGAPPKLKSPLLVQNREKRNEIKRSREGKTISILRPGMVLLKRYIACEDQVKIVKTCRQLGKGSGGFYQPGYRDGATLHLKMMCLGKNWDPETSNYGERRQVDGAKPPLIPSDFNHLVKKAIQDAHASLQKDGKPKNVEKILPSMSPDICIVNFYTNSGRLGLHQDKDESAESLNRELPVVSISVGDSADFLYGDQRDIEKADKVILESGDVLIFGGKSRHVFHGVSNILSNTAPQQLLEESNLRPGRLNLTFRKY